MEKKGDGALAMQLTDTKHSGSAQVDYDPLHNVSSTEVVSIILRYFVMFWSYLFSVIPITWMFCIKIFDQYERAVIFRLGKLKSIRAEGPGIMYFMPFVDTFKRVDLRIKTVPVSAQDVMTQDSVSIRVDAVVFFHVEDATKAVLRVQNFMTATSLIASTTLRCIVGESELDELLTKRDKISKKLKQVLQPHTAPWGIKVDSVEIRDVKLPFNMQRVMASQAEAERDRRAKVISAEGEKQAAEALLNAAENMSKNPATLQLRYLQTLTQIAVEHPTTIVYPLPMKLGSLGNMKKMMKPLANILGLTNAAENTKLKSEV